jgi:hypothetical protein
MLRSEQRITVIGGIECSASALADTVLATSDLFLSSRFPLPPIQVMNFSNETGFVVLTASTGSRPNGSSGFEINKMTINWSNYFSWMPVAAGLMFSSTIASNG